VYERIARILTIGVTVALASSPAASADGKLDAKLQLTSHAPGTPTGAILNLIRPDGPDGKPKPEAVGVFQLPAGTTIDERAVPACTKDDTTWQIEGEAACPDSHIGEGFATLLTGFGPPLDPLTVDDHWYHAPGQIVALYTSHGQSTPVLKVGRVQIKGATFIAPLDLPPVGYPPGTKTVPKESDVTLDRHVGSQGSFITTPSRCPASRRWIAKVTLTYDDGTTDSATDATPCQVLGRRGSGTLP
jgi:hypothetical protein